MYYFTPMELVIINKIKQKITSVDEKVEKLQYLYIAGEDVSG